MRKQLLLVIDVQKQFEVEDKYGKILKFIDESQLPHLSAKAL